MKNSWKDISIKDYIELLDIVKNSKSEVDKVINIICLMTGEEPSVVENYPISKSNALLEQYSFINKEPENTEIKYEFDFPELTLYFNKNVENLTTRQYMDIVEISKEENTIDKLHIILSCLAEVEFKDKEPKNFDLSEYILNNFNIEDAYALHNFFLLSYETLTLLSLDMKKKIIQNQMKNLTIDKEKAAAQVLVNDLELSQLSILQKM